jgi:hypothetical protein
MALFITLLVMLILGSILLGKKGLMKLDDLIPSE